MPLRVNLSSQCYLHLGFVVGQTATVVNSIVDHSNWGLGEGCYIDDAVYIQRKVNERQNLIPGQQQNHKTQNLDPKSAQLFAPLKQVISTITIDFTRLHQVKPEVDMVVIALSKNGLPDLPDIDQYLPVGLTLKKLQESLPESFLWLEELEDNHSTGTVKSNNNSQSRITSSIIAPGHNNNSRRNSNSSNNKLSNNNVSEPPILYFKRINLTDNQGCCVLLSMIKDNEPGKSRVNWYFSEICGTMESKTLNWEEWLSGGAGQENEQDDNQGNRSDVGQFQNRSDSQSLESRDMLRGPLKNQTTPQNLRSSTKSISPQNASNTSCASIQRTIVDELDLIEPPAQQQQSIQNQNQIQQQSSSQQQYFNDNNVSPPRLHPPKASSPVDEEIYNDSEVYPPKTESETANEVLKLDSYTKSEQKDLKSNHMNTLKRNTSSKDLKVEQVLKYQNLDNNNLNIAPGSGDSNSVSTTVGNSMSQQHQHHQQYVYGGSSSSTSLPIDNDNLYVNDVLQSPKQSTSRQPPRTPDSGSSGDLLASPQNFRCVPPNRLSSIPAMESEFNEDCARLNSDDEEILLDVVKNRNSRNSNNSNSYQNNESVRSQRLNCSNSRRSRQSSKNSSNGHVTLNKNQNQIQDSINLNSRRSSKALSNYSKTSSRVDSRATEKSKGSRRSRSRSQSSGGNHNVVVRMKLNNQPGHEGFYEVNQDEDIDLNGKNDLNDPESEPHSNDDDDDENLDDVVASGTDNEIGNQKFDNGTKIVSGSSDVNNNKVSSLQINSNSDYTVTNNMNSRNTNPANISTNSNYTNFKQTLFHDLSRFEDLPKDNQNHSTIVENMNNSSGFPNVRATFNSEKMKARDRRNQSQQEMILNSTNLMHSITSVDDILGVSLNGSRSNANGNSHAVTQITSRQKQDLSLLSKLFQQQRDRDYLSDGGGNSSRVGYHGRSNSVVSGGQTHRSNGSINRDRGTSNQYYTTNSTKDNPGPYQGPDTPQTNPSLNSGNRYTRPRSNSRGKMMNIVNSTKSKSKFPSRNLAETNQEFQDGPNDNDTEKSDSEEEELQDEEIDIENDHQIHNEQQVGSNDNESPMSTQSSSDVDPDNIIIQDNLILDDQLLKSQSQSHSQSISQDPRLSRYRAGNMKNTMSRDSQAALLAALFKDDVGDNSVQKTEQKKITKSANGSVIVNKSNQNDSESKRSSNLSNRSTNVKAKSTGETRRSKIKNDNTDSKTNLLLNDSSSNSMLIVNNCTNGDTNLNEPNHHSKTTNIQSTKSQQSVTQGKSQSRSQPGPQSQQTMTVTGSDSATQQNQKPIGLPPKYPKSFYDTLTKKLAKTVRSTISTQLKELHTKVDGLIQSEQNKGSMTGQQSNFNLTPALNNMAQSVVNNYRQQVMQQRNRQQQYVNGNFNLDSSGDHQPGDPHADNFHDAAGSESALTVSVDLTSRPGSAIKDQSNTLKFALNVNNIVPKRPTSRPSSVASRSESLSGRKGSTRCHNLDDQQYYAMDIEGSPPSDTQSNTQQMINNLLDKPQPITQTVSNPTTILGPQSQITSTTSTNYNNHDKYLQQTQFESQQQPTPDILTSLFRPRSKNQNQAQNENKSKHMLYRDYKKLLNPETSSVLQQLNNGDDANTAKRVEPSPPQQRIGRKQSKTALLRYDYNLNQQDQDQEQDVDMMVNDNDFDLVEEIKNGLNSNCSDNSAIDLPLPDNSPEPLQTITPKPHLVQDLDIGIDQLISSPENQINSHINNNDLNQNQQQGQGDGPAVIQIIDLEAQNQEQIAKLDKARGWDDMLNLQQNDDAGTNPMSFEHMMQMMDQQQPEEIQIQSQISSMKSKGSSLKFQSQMQNKLDWVAEENHADLELEDNTNTDQNNLNQKVKTNNCSPQFEPTPPESASAAGDINDLHTNIGPTSSLSYANLQTFNNLQQATKKPEAQNLPKTPSEQATLLGATRLGLPQTVINTQVNTPMTQFNSIGTPSVWTGNLQGNNNQPPAALESQWPQNLNSTGTGLGPQRRELQNNQQLSNSNQNQNQTQIPGPRQQSQFLRAINSVGPISHDDSLFGSHSGTKSNNLRETLIANLVNGDEQDGLGSSGKKQTQQNKNINSQRVIHQDKHGSSNLRINGNSSLKPSSVQNIEFSSGQKTQWSSSIPEIEFPNQMNQLDGPNQIQIQNLNNSASNTNLNQNHLLMRSCGLSSPSSHANNSNVMKNNGAGSQSGSGPSSTVQVTRPPRPQSPYHVNNNNINKVHNVVSNSPAPAPLVDPGCPRIGSGATPDLRPKAEAELSMTAPSPPPQLQKMSLPDPGLNMNNMNQNHNHRNLKGFNLSSTMSPSQQQNQNQNPNHNHTAPRQPSPASFLGARDSNESEKGQAMQSTYYQQQQSHNHNVPGHGGPVIKRRADIESQRAAARSESPFVLGGPSPGLMGSGQNNQIQQQQHINQGSNLSQSQQQQQLLRNSISSSNFGQNAYNHNLLNQSLSNSMTSSVHTTNGVNVTGLSGPSCPQGRKGLDELSSRLRSMQAARRAGQQQQSGGNALQTLSQQGFNESQHAVGIPISVNGPSLNQQSNTNNNSLYNPSLSLRSSYGQQGTGISNNNNINNVNVNNLMNKSLGLDSPICHISNIDNGGPGSLSSSIRSQFEAKKREIQNSSTQTATMSTVTTVPHHHRRHGENNLRQPNTLLPAHSKFVQDNDKILEQGRPVIQR